MATTVGVILAGGKGSRMVDTLADQRPKQMIEAGGVSLLERVMRTGKEEGLTEFILATGYQAEAVEAFALEIGERLGVKVRCIPEEIPGQASSLLSIESALSGRDFVLMMADHVSRGIISDLRQQDAGGGVILAVDRDLEKFHRNQDPHFWEDVTKVRIGASGAIEQIGKDIDAQHVTAYDTGFFLMSPQVLTTIRELLHENDKPSLSQAVTRLAQSGRAHTRDINRTAFWYDADDAVALHHAVELMEIPTTLVAIPFHAKHTAHVDQFMKNLPQLLSQLPAGATVYVDANGCSEEVERMLSRRLANIRNVELHIEHQGGRSPAMNRIVDKAIRERCDNVVFVNDDLHIAPGSIGSLTDALEQHEIVGGVSRPMTEQHTKTRPTLAQQSSIYYHYQVMQVENWQFTGDCFAVRTDLLAEIKASNPTNEAFPNVHTDDRYLEMKMRELRGNAHIPVLPDVQVFFEAPATWRQTAHRTARHLQGARDVFQSRRSMTDERAVNGFMRAYQEFTAQSPDAVSVRASALHPEVREMLETWNEVMPGFLEIYPHYEGVLPTGNEVAHHLQARMTSRGRGKPAEDVAPFLDKLAFLLGFARSEGPSIIHGGVSWERESAKGRGFIRGDE